MAKVDVQQEEDGTYTASLEGKDTCWTSAPTEKAAIAGLTSLYPNEVIYG